ncbi:MAG TPA: hypothetical protein VNO21_12145, partial [Polyangiaceae bacterium]|nr:hypothetical protein [Polyangiaceae bacterium]
DFAPALHTFEDAFHAAMHERLCARLGLRSRGVDDDAHLADALFGFLDADASSGSPVGYEPFFFDWYGGTAREARALAGPSAAHYRGAAFDVFREAIALYELADGAALEHPYFASRTSPCTLLIDEIETIWDAIAERDDWSLFEAKIAEMREMPALTGSET